MYSIFIRNMTVVNSEELCIYSDETVEDKFKVESASLKLQEGNAGSLTLKMLPINVGYNEIETLATQVIVRKDGAVYWFGRVIEVKIDYDNNKEVLCEGALNYLMDTIQPPYHVSSSISSWITHLIEAHNTMVSAANEPWKQVVVGYVDPNINPSTNTDLYTNYETTLDMIGNACQGWEAHPLFTYQVDSTTKFPRLVLNFYKTYYLDSDGIPEIVFGENLSDYTKEIKNEDVATVVIPLGKEYTDEERVTIQQQWTDHPSDPTAWTEPKPDTDITDLDWRRTVYSVNSQSIYLYDTQANLNRYGYNCKTIEFSEAIDYAELKAAGEKYLRDQKWDKLTLTLSGYDLSLLDYNLSPIKMGGLVHCLSKPHGLDYNYPCTAIEENLLDVTATIYTLGTADNKYITDSSRQTDQKLRDAVTQAVAREKVIQQNSYNYTDGSVTDVYNELEAEIQAISFDPSEAVEEAKANALQLLNIYDEDDNPSHKGYVYFIKENADYDAGTEISLVDLKARVNRHFDTSNIDNFFNNLATTLENQGTNTELTIFIMLGPNDYQTSICVFGSNNQFKKLNGDLWFRDFTAYGVSTKIATGYNPNNFDVRGYFYSCSSVSHLCSWYGYSDTVDNYYCLYHADENGFQDPFDTDYNIYERRYHLPYPTEGNFLHLPDNYSMYSSRPIYSSLDSANVEVSPQVVLESVIVNPVDHITELVISNNVDYMSPEAGLWRFNKEGLYYLEGGYNTNTLTPNTETHEGYQSVDERLRLALTKDGNIVADRITAGKLDANVIRTGVIQSQNDNGSALQIAMDTGTILAKKARIVFANSREHANTPALPDQALNEFAYFSNEPLNRWMNVSGQTSKDWMLVIGSSFGVDKFGRTYMREGHIGGVGGAFDIKAYNDQPIGPRYGSTPIDVGTPIYYEVSLSSDAYRPDPVEPIATQCKFFFRLGYYSAPNTITCVTNIEGFVFEAGTTPEEYEFIFETQEAGVYPYYPGELFPVWYLEGTSTDYDYEEDGDYYKQQTGVNSNYIVEITGYYDSDQETPTMPQYKSWTDERISAATQHSGTIHIGTGYLDNGNIGQSNSFFLGGITRSGYVAGQSKNNWKFTVGSNFGVDDNGNFYSNDGYLRNAHVEGTVTTSGLNVGYVGSLQVNSHLHDRVVGSDIVLRWRIFRDDLNGHTMFTNSTRMSITVTSGNRANLPTNPVIEFQPAEGYYIGNPPSYDRHQRDVFRITYDRNGSDRQDFFIDTSTWDNVNVGEYATGYIYITVTLNNQSQTFILSSQAQLKERYDDDIPGEGELYYCVGDISFTRYDTVQGQSCIRAGTPLCGSSLGANYDADFWNHAYIKNIHSTVTESGSSSKIYKHDIEGLDLRYDKLLDILRPVRFRFNKDHYDDGEQYHAGFILEELKENMDIAGIKPEEFGAYDPNPDGKGGGIRYSEFIPLIIDQLQKLKRENEDLKRQLYEKGILDD